MPLKPHEGNTDNGKYRKLKTVGEEGVCVRVLYAVCIATGSSMPCKTAFIAECLPQKK